MYVADDGLLLICNQQKNKQQQVRSERHGRKAGIRRPLPGCHNSGTVYLVTRKPLIAQLPKGCLQRRFRLTQIKTNLKKRRIYDTMGQIGMYQEQSIRSIV